jgi:hypothetical protein
MPDPPVGDRGGAVAGGDPEMHALPQAASDKPALDERPQFSLRNLIAIGFALCFLLAVALNLLWIITTVRIQGKLHNLEIADSYLFEIQQARR